MGVQSVEASPSSGLQAWLNPVGLAWLALAAMLASLGSARSVLSIGLGILGAAMIWHLATKKQTSPVHTPSYRSLALLAAGLFGLAVLSGFQTDSFSDWLTDLTAKLPFLIIPLTLYLLPPFSRKQLYLLAFVFVISQTLIALLSLGMYFGNYEEVIDQVAKNSNVDVATGVSHIYFGTILAFATCLGLYLFVRKVVVWKSWEPKLWLALTLINFIALHLFTSRTGLMALYGGLGLGGLYYLVGKKIWWVGAILVGFMVLTPILAYQFVPSFRLRVDVTLWDVQQFQNSEADLSFNSASLRLLAWETALELIEEHPVLGVGLEDVKSEMELAYQQNGAYERAKEPLDDPHNQYLTIALGTGIGGLLLLLGLLSGLVIGTPPPARLLAITFVGLMAAALLFESILERQIGMTLWALCIMLIPYWGNLGQKRA